MSEQPLLRPYDSGLLHLKNRVVMAPMTRSRADNPEKAPTDIHVEYYKQRASAGLIITEGSQISQEAVGYINTPGIHSPAQVAGWKRVVEAVHERGGSIYIQLWHVGRVSHPDFHGGRPPVAPSAINPEKKVYTPSGWKETVAPREMTKEEIKSTVEDYVKATKNAMEAGFDGVEIHSANGYLLEQFLRDSGNHRTDEYGGTVENRTRFLLEVVDAVSKEIGSKKTGVRLSPANVLSMPADSNTRELFEYVVKQLDTKDLAYLHLRDASEDVSSIPNMIVDVTAHFRPLFHGTLITNTGYDQKKGNDAISLGKADLVAYGVPYIANPDLVERFRQNAPLAEGNRDTFYMGGKEGYIDYPPLASVSAN